MPPITTLADALFDAPTHPELEGRRVLLSGLTDDIGVGVAEGLARQRTRLVLNSFQAANRAAASADALKPKAAAVRMFSGPADPDQATCERLARAALGAFGGVDLLVNVIGASRLRGARPRGDRDVEDGLAADLRSAHVLTRSLADHALASGLGATVVHLAAIDAGSPMGPGYYALLKTAIESMVREQAQRWFERDICVYGFVPGSSGLLGADAEQAVENDEARPSFDSAVLALLLNSAAGRSRWLNGVTVTVPV